MSDTSLPQIIRYGTAAERAAFTPTPASGSQVLYIWYETDNAPDTYVWDGSAWVQINAGAGSSQSLVFGTVIDGGGSVITTGVKGFVRVPRASTITKVTVLSIDGSATAGNIVLDIWKDTYANYPPTVADTITAAAKPTLAGANKFEDTTLIGWTKTINAGDVFGFNVDSVTTVTKVLLMVEASIP